MTHTIFWRKGNCSRPVFNKHQFFHLLFPLLLHFRDFNQPTKQVIHSFCFRSMITRSKLVEQLRDYQIRSQHKWSPLTLFSPTPYLADWTDVAVALLLTLLFIVLLVSSYVTLYMKHYWISVTILCLVIILPLRLKVSRQSLARRRDRRFLLPLSM